MADMTKLEQQADLLMQNIEKRGIKNDEIYSRRSEEF